MLFIFFSEYNFYLHNRICFLEISKQTRLLWPPWSYAAWKCSLFYLSYFRNPQLRDRKRRRKHSNNTEIIFPFYYLKITPVRGGKKKESPLGKLR